MHLIFRKEEQEKAQIQAGMPEPEVTRPLWQNAVYFLTMVGILVFANWGKPNDFRFELKEGPYIHAAVLKETGTAESSQATYQLKVLSGPREGQAIDVPAEDVLSKTLTPSAWKTIWSSKWAVTSIFSLALAILLIAWFGMKWWKIALAFAPAGLLAFMYPKIPMIPFAAGVIGLSTITSTDKGETGDWFSSSWSFAKQIMPLLFGGVLVAGLLLGSPTSTDGGLIPSAWISDLVGGNSLQANLFASIVGAFMYFATLTEVPILQGLISNGMGQGPALALLLAGPALSLPNMLVIRSVIGTRKTIVFVLLVIVMATMSGIIFGFIAG
jgi:hypothetical protein